MCINFCCSVLWSNNPTVHLKNCFHCDTSSEHIFRRGRCKSMPLVALAVIHSIILLVLLRYRKQQMANTALDPGQHLPTRHFREAEGTSRNKCSQWVHTLENREIQQDKQNPRVQKNLRRMKWVGSLPRVSRKPVLDPLTEQIISFGTQEPQAAKQHSSATTSSRSQH